MSLVVTVFSFFNAMWAFDLLTHYFAGMERGLRDLPAAVQFSADIAEWFDRCLFWLLPFTLVLAVTDAATVLRPGGAILRPFSASSRAWVVLITAWLPLLLLGVAGVGAALSVPVWLLAGFLSLLGYRVLFLRAAVPEAQLRATFAALLNPVVLLVSLGVLVEL